MSEAQEVVLLPGRTYRVGQGGLVVVYADGHRVDYPAGATVVMDEGAARSARGRARLVRIRRYETQAVRPAEEG